ncbi:MAG: hypothetical protein P1V36_12350 [Planctomycetota bacterium]|nr:hypothetical protein [Planctomycetota bacterium]
MRRMLPLVLVTGLLAALFAASADAKDKLPDLRRQLLEAQGDARIGGALDKLSATIGKPGFFEDAGAFGDWLGTLPDGRAEHPLVQLRRGWAYVAVKRGEEAIPFLQVGVKDNPGDGLRRAYLGEALRQAKRHVEAAEMLAAAVRCGHHGKHVHESILKTVFDARRAKISGHADALPDYATAAGVYLAVRPEPDIHFVVAQLLLEDFDTYEKPDRTRGKLWARTAGEHALAAFRLAPTPPAGGATLAFDAARALEFLDRVERGRTDRFALLVKAHELGQDPSGGPPRYPQALVFLAEGAAAEGRFELAHRLATQRLEISNSPRARRLLQRLPPDLGTSDDE